MTEILLLSNLGLGDNIFNISIINYLSEKNKVTTVLWERNYEQFKYFFVDNENVSFFLLHDVNERNTLFYRN